MKGALIVGIDNYSFQPLDGCVGDANSLSKLLSTHENEDPNFEVKLMTSDKTGISTAILKEEISRLFSIEEDVALFYFSGHGTSDETGGYLLTPDGARVDQGIPVQTILNLANKSRSKERIIILDCCNSGTMGNLAGTNNEAVMSEGLTILTATKANQKAEEKFGGGLFTSLLLDALAGGAADVMGKVTIASLYSYIDNVLGFFEQRPLYKSHVSKLMSIRNCAPSVEIKLIRKLSEYFNSRDSEYILNPSYEPTYKDHIPANGEIFLCLQKCRAAGLVEPVPPYIHLYQTAMDSKACRLTRLGKYYWYLAKRGRLRLNP